MQFCNVICISILAASLLGCQRNPPPDASNKKTKSPSAKETRLIARPDRSQTLRSTGWEVQTDVTRLPEIIKRVFEELGITLEQEDQKPGRYEYLGKSPSGAGVTVEAIAIVKGSWYLQIHVWAEKPVAKLLLDRVSRALARAVKPTPLKSSLPKCCPVTPGPASSPRAGPAVEGNLRFQGQPIEAFTSIEPLFSFNNLDTEQKGIKARIEYSKGQFKIYDMPEGNYNIFVSINANTDNPGRYPGYPGDFFKRLLRIPIPPEGSAKLDIDLEKVIHLTLPQDNGRIMQLWGELGENMIAFENPIEFAWDSLGDNVQYHYTINRMQSNPFKYLERHVEKTTTSQTTVSIELPLNRENEFYLFHLYATKVQHRIG